MMHDQAVIKRSDKRETGAIETKPTRINPSLIRTLAYNGNGRESLYALDKSIHLYMVVSPQGAKSFLYRRYISGTWRQTKLGEFTDVLDAPMARVVIREIESKAHELESRVNRGENPFNAIAANKQQLTLAELFEAYMTRHVEKSRKLIEPTRKDFERWLTIWGNRKASQITRAMVEKLHGQMAVDRGPYSANRAIQLGRAIYNKAILWRLYDGDNPFRSITLHRERARERFLSAIEAGRLFKALQNVPTADDSLRQVRDFVLLAMMTGVRKSNLYSMQWREIDLKAGTWTIPDTKNGTAQMIPLGAGELEILQGRRDLLKQNSVISPYVFPSKHSESGHLMEIKKTWDKLRKACGLEDVHIHDLRRSLGATMANQNVNVALVKSVLHHKNMQTTLRHYARTGKEAELEAKQLAHKVWSDAADKADDPLAPVVTLKTGTD